MIAEAIPEVSESMWILINGAGLFIVAFILQIFLWRTDRIRKTPGNIFIIFICVYAAWVMTIFLTQVSVNFHLSNEVRTAHSLLLALSLFIAYMVVYPGIESDSPSCSVLLTVERAGDQGIGEDKLLLELGEDQFVPDRLRGLVRDGKLLCLNGRYQLTPQGRSFLTLFQRVYQPFSGGSGVNQ